MNRGYWEGLSLEDPWIISNVQILGRLLLALLLGGLIGYERERSNHAAGLRTHILVCVGSTLIMMLSVYGFVAFIDEPNVRIDPARLATAVITGVGFLGAGTILFTGKSITGLTTAASIWVVAAIGLGVGAGFYFASIVSTVIVLLNLWIFNKIEQRYMSGQKVHIIILKGFSSPDLLERISDFMSEEEIKIKKVTIKEENSMSIGRLPSEGRAVEIQMEVLCKPGFDQLRIAGTLRNWEELSGVSVE